ncbi:hypothetical protein [Sessilibacter sp. MAH2]
MNTVKKIEYTLKSSVAGAAVGLAVCGLVSFLPAVTVSLGVAELAAVVGSASLSLYALVTA